MPPTASQAEMRKGKQAFCHSQLQMSIGLETNSRLRRRKEIEIQQSPRSVHRSRKMIPAKPQLPRQPPEPGELLSVRADALNRMGEFI